MKPRLLHLELMVHPGGTRVGIELSAATLYWGGDGDHPWCPPITWVTLGGWSWHWAALPMLGRGQARRQPESMERWRRELKQSICYVHRFLMHPVACLALRGSIRRRCLEKLSTAHCSKTLDYLTTTARSPRGTGRTGTGLDVPSGQHPSNLHPCVTHPMDGHGGEKVNVLATCRGSPHGSVLPKRVLPPLQG